VSDVFDGEERNEAGLEAESKAPHGKEWNTGMVSSMVTSREKVMSTVPRTCTSTAVGDESGRSSRL
jgi:hypothetical protein